MTVCYLVRHAAHDLLGRVLVGRQDGVAFSGAGRLQTVRLAERLASLPITHIQSSPRVRALQTAAPVARRSGLAVDVWDALDEIDFGSWTGQRFSDLAADPRWRRWNTKRAESKAPGGERMTAVQTRITMHLLQMHALHPKGSIIMVSHAEVIRAAMLHILGMPLDAWQAVDVGPASVKAVRVLPHGCEIIGFEERAAA